MKFVLLIFLLILGGRSLSQRNYQFLFDKGSVFLAEEDWEQARYYFHLAYKQLEERDSALKQLVSKEVFKTDSLSAYHVEDETFLSLIKRGDSLSKCCSPVYAIKAFDDASNYYKGNHYPSARIDQIIAASPKIKEKLMVIQANHKRQEFMKNMEVIDEIERAGLVLEAYFRYKNLSNVHPKNEELLAKIQSIEDSCGEKIERFDEAYALANKSYLNGDYKEAKINCAIALELNSECLGCQEMEMYLEYYLKFEGSDSLKLVELKNDANINYLTGKYEAAYLQYGVLMDLAPEDSVIYQRVDEMQMILEKEQEEKYRIQSAKLLLEKANSHFMEYKFNKALETYLVIENRYLDVIDYEGFLSNRIAECLQELNAN